MKIKLFDTNIEAGIINTITYNKLFINDIITILKKEHFYSDFNADVFDYIINCYLSDIEISNIDLFNKFGAKYTTEIATKIDYLNVAQNSLELIELSVKRKIFAGINKILNDFPNLQTFEILEKGSKLFENATLTDKHLFTTNDLYKDFEGFIEKAKDPNYFIKTGFGTYDKFYSAFYPGQLIVLGARSSVGKTAFAVNLMLNLINNNKRVLLYSMEMAATEITKRVISILNDVTIDDINKLNDQAIELSKNTLKRLSKNNNLLIDTNSKHNEISLVRSAKLYKQKYDIDFIVIDYLQLIKTSNPTKNRNYDIGIITSELKSLALQLNIPIFLLAQLNRESVKVGERPELHHLKDSGNIEQDADTVIFLHKKKESDDLIQFMELIIAKQRQGRTGIIDFEYIKRFMKFIDVNAKTYENNINDYEDAPF